MTTARSIIILSVLFSLNLSLSAQPQFGLKVGRVYLINSEYYETISGYSAKAFFYPISVNNLSIGVDAGYISKGSIPNQFTHGKKKIIEYISIGIPINYEFSNSKQVDLYANTVLSYDINLGSNIVEEGNHIHYLNSNYVFSVGAGLNYKKSNPNLVIELSYNRELGEFIKYKITNSYIDLKFGLAFGGL